MSAKIIGNHGYYNRGGISGVGVEEIGPLVGQLTTVVADSASVIALSVAQVATSTYQMGICVQSDVAATIKYSLSNPALAASQDPDVRAQAIWTTAQTITPNAIDIVTPLFFTAMEITFPSAGFLYVYAR